MVWLVDKPEPHECRVPSLWFKRPGRRWQCDDCDEIWVIRITGPWGQMHKYWFRESLYPKSVDQVSEIRNTTKEQTG